MFRTSTNTLGSRRQKGTIRRAARKSVTPKYLHIVRHVCFSIISWPKEEGIEATDIKRSKLLTMHGGFRPESGTLRL